MCTYTHATLIVFKIVPTEHLSMIKTIFKLSFQIVLLEIFISYTRVLMEFS